MRSEGTPAAKASLWTHSDAETRKPGEQTGLDTPVVLAVNIGHWVVEPPMVLLPQGNREVPRLGSMVARLKLKGIDGGSHKRWMMWLNSRLREEPYPSLDMLGNPAERWECPSGSPCTGAAWLSSARVVRCRVKSLNERNPCP